MKRLLIAVMVPALFLGCSEQKHQPQPAAPPVGQYDRENVILIKTTDDKPIANAQVLIGDAQGSPFPGNYLTTDSSGQITVPAGWTQPASVTVQAAGYIRATYMAQTPGALTITLQAVKNGPAQYEVRGASQNLPVVNGDDQIDFGLVMSAFTRGDMLSFNLNQVISPQIDTISAMGQDIHVPSNISIPNQNENYSFFNITLDKPVYRTYFGQKGLNRLVSIRGRFPFSDTVDAMRSGKAFYELINMFKLTGGGVRDLDVQNASSSLNIPSTELNFTDKKTLVAPTVTGDELFIAVGVANQSGYMIPTDIKSVASGKKQVLGTLPNADQWVLGVVKKAADLKSGSDRMSVTLLPFANQIAPKMLPLINDPSLLSPREISFPQVNPIAGVNPIATYSVISSELEVQQGPSKVKVMNPEWQIYAANWVSGMKLPNWPTASAANSKKRWEVSFIGSQTASQAQLGPAMIEAATHVTHSSISF